ncbi:uncharacterized protein CEXT_637401 [Caerostris extrusa]|uniref:Uncharacterized protein n=1 Tax=Caerostris extrusa TaxID=172846 RepID=A0AAV4N1Z6_CAEEX|nr:uncharacterized protein CEXT_637401 [Caerostris extrusa]
MALQPAATSSSPLINRSTRKRSRHFFPGSAATSLFIAHPARRSSEDVSKIRLLFFNQHSVRKRSAELSRPTPQESRGSDQRVPTETLQERVVSRIRRVWGRGSKQQQSQVAQPPPPQQNHVDKNGTPTPPSVDAHLAAREALQETANDSCKTAAIPLELSRIESGERRQSSGYPPAQLSRTSLLGKPPQVRETPWTPVQKVSSPGVQFPGTAEGVQIGLLPHPSPEIARQTHSHVTVREFLKPPDPLRDGFRSFMRWGPLGIFLPWAPCPLPWEFYDLSCESAIENISNSF